MSITAIPLIIGIGIDNGIHLVRRYLENERLGILAIAKATGPALIQSNLTTIVGFGALMASSFTPLAEMGLVTSLGVALALAGGLLLIPAVILVQEQHAPTIVLARLIRIEGLLSPGRVGRHRVQARLETFRIYFKRSTFAKP